MSWSDYQLRVTDKNVLAAIDVAKTKGIQCIGMTAQGGGKMAEVCDICMAVPCPVTARAQEIHILIWRYSVRIGGW